MCPAHIAFSIPKRPEFTWIDTFEGVENAELQELIVECRSALHSLQAELATRQNPQVDTSLEYCYARLQEKAQKINNLGVLGTKDREALEEADPFLGALRSDNVDRIPVPSDDEPRGTLIVTSNGLRMAEAASNVPVVVGGLGRCERYKSTYRTLGVAAQKDFRSGKDFMKDAASRTTMKRETA